VLRAASAAVRAGKTVDGLRQWALAVQGRSNHNKATCALAVSDRHIGATA
jgi:hypothetical protein